MKIRTSQPVVPRLRVIQDKVDGAIAGAAKDAPVSCKAGCSACCRQFVTTMPVEARGILEFCKKNHIEIDWEYVREYAKWSLEAQRKRVEYFGKKCPFLTSSGLCGIYPVRPLSCRTVLVISPPENCGDPKGKVLKLDMMVAEGKVFDGNDTSTFGPGLKGMDAIRTLQFTDTHERHGKLKAQLGDVVGPLPLMVDLARRGVEPWRIREKVGQKTGILGLSGDEQHEGKSGKAA